MREMKMADSYLLRLESGEEIVAALNGLAAQHRIDEGDLPAQEVRDVMAVARGQLRNGRRGHDLVCAESPVRLAQE